MEPNRIEGEAQARDRASSEAIEFHPIMNPERDFGFGASSGAARTRLIALFSGGLLFLGSGLFAYSYLSEASPRAQTAQAERAAETTEQAAVSPKPNAYAGISLQAQSAYVYDLATGRELFELDPSTPRPMASMTKIAMALAVLSALRPEDVITIPYDTAPPGSAERLSAGETWSVQNVLDFTLVASSNVGADILSQAANGAIAFQNPGAPQTGESDATVWKMNEIARSLGLSSMAFYNDNGLDIDATHAGAYGSARDVARLFAYAATSSGAAFAATEKDSISLTSQNGVAASAYNTDEALSAIPGIILGKTGYTDLAGGNLGVVFDVEPAHPIVIVVMGSTESGRFSDMKKLVQATLSAVNGE